MREIKFRGKQVESKEWVYGFYYKDLHINRIHIIIGTEKTIRNENRPHLVEVIPETVGQFIKLYDKHKKEFYTDDIITKDGKRFSIIEYENGGYFARALPGKYHHGGFFHISMTTTSYYVAGNKFDNPELLGTVK